MRKTPDGSPRTSARTRHRRSLNGSTDRVTRMGNVDWLVAIVIDLPGSKPTTEKVDVIVLPRNTASCS